MYLESSASELPGFLSSPAEVRNVVNELGAAAEAVEAGNSNGEDHPKQKTLRQELVTVNALNAVSITTLSLARCFPLLYYSLLVLKWLKSF